MKISFSCWSILSVSSVFAQSDSLQKTGIHFQQTTVTQYHGAFKAPYTGDNSLQNKNETATSLTSTIYAGLRLWRNGVFYINPEMAGGEGFSTARGIAGFPNGETFRVGNPKPAIYLARAYFSQVFALDKSTHMNPDGLNSLQGPSPDKYIFINVGKFCLADFFDNNTYSHDPRKQFLNWSLMSNGAYDYAANTRGYTQGLVLGFNNQRFSINYAAVLEPKVANGPQMDYTISKAWAQQVELSKAYTAHQKNGVLRLLFFVNKSNMGNYSNAIAKAISENKIPDITSTRSYNSLKYGFGVNGEQQLSDNVGIFYRASWNNGTTETWAYTEIDRSISIGLHIDNTLNARKNDEVGLAVVVNGLSPDHARYLQHGGYGFIVGDGTLHYKPEIIGEAYYNFSLSKKRLSFSPSYQFILNPAYNADRGPVQVLSIRSHIEI